MIGHRAVTLPDDRMPGTACHDRMPVAMIPISAWVCAYDSHAIKRKDELERVAKAVR